MFNSIRRVALVFQALEKSAGKTLSTINNKDDDDSLAYSNLKPNRHFPVDKYRTHTKKRTHSRDDNDSRHTIH